MIGRSSPKYPLCITKLDKQERDKSDAEKVWCLLNLPIDKIKK